MSQAYLESYTTSSASLIATYFAFVVDKATHFKRDLQDMTRPINWKMYPEVDFLLSQQPT